MNERDMIQRRLDSLDLAVEREPDWREGEDGVEAGLGAWEVIHENEYKGLYEGDSGELVACVVGAPEYGNQRVSFVFIVEGSDAGEEVQPLEDVEPA